MTQHTLELTVLCENSVAGPFGLIGEHGWSVLVEVRGRMILFDTGQGQGLINNSLKLNKDLSRVDALVLSHGHYDHASGIPQIASLKKSLPIYCHPDVFIPRFWAKDGSRRFIGMIHRKNYLESIGCNFRFFTSFTEIFPGIYITGEVPRVTDFEPPDPHMEIEVEKDGKIIVEQDPLRDDLSMVVDTPSGLVIILGCAHAGLINILHHVRSKLPNKKIHTVIGGTHLGFAKTEQLERTIKELDDFGIERLGASHCTGLANSARLFGKLKERFFYASVGVIVKL